MSNHRPTQPSPEHWRGWKRNHIKPDRLHFSTPFDRMMHHAYVLFWSKRGLPAPTVDCTCLEAYTTEQRATQAY